MMMKMLEKTGYNRDSSVDSEHTQLELSDTDTKLTAQPNIDDQSQSESWFTRFKILVSGYMQFFWNFLPDRRAVI